MDVDRREFLAAGASLALTGAGTRTHARPRARATPIPRRLQDAIRGKVFAPGVPGYPAVAHIYNTRFDGERPKFVARPLDARDVGNAVRWAVAHSVPIRARGGGHSYAGYSTINGGLVLDLRKLTGISVNKRAKTASVGAGCQLIDVYAGLARKGATIPGGSCPSVGIAGVTLGGGMGLAGRAFGLTIDNLVGAQIVTADGKVRTVNKHTDPGLLWALRGGGGGNFGVVTQFTFNVHPLPASASYFFVSWPWSQASGAINAWQQWAPHARDELTSIFHLEADGDGHTAVSVSGQFLGSSGALPSLLSPLTAVPGASVRSGQHDYLSLQMLFAGCSTKTLAACHTVGASSGGTLPRASFRAKSDYVKTALPPAARQKLIAAVETRASQAGTGAILFDSYGGAINRVKPGATAFVHRSQLFCIQYLDYGGGPGWLNGIHGGMRPFVSGEAYQNYIDQDLGTWRQAYYNSNYARLKQIRHRVDPDHRFNFPQAIGR